MRLPTMVTPPAAVAVLCALVVGIVAAGCAAPPRAGTTPAETAPAASAPPSAQAWAPQPWTPDFSRPPAKAIAPSATTPPIPVPDPKRDAREEILRRYEGAWKAMLAKRNGVRVADVEKGVSITKEWIDETATGAWFRVTYTASLDWAKVEAKDSFVVKVDAANPLAPRAPDLVGRWLSAAEVASFAERAPATAKLANVAFGKHLKFDSEIEALSALAKLPGRRVGGGKPAYELAMKGAARGHILLYTNVFVGDNFCAAWVIDLVTAKSCRASPHSCADDLDITAPFPSDRNGPPDHECTQP